MDVISLGKAMKVLKEITDLNQNTIGEGARDRFKTVDHRLDWMEGQADKMMVEGSRQVDMSTGQFEDTEFISNTRQLKLKEIPAKPGPANLDIGLPMTGSGTSSDPFLIKNPEHLNEVRNHLDSVFHLDNDIDMNVEPYNTGEGWMPINGFRGTFEGNGYSIKNLYINRPDLDNVGLFGNLNGSVIIKSFSITCDITGNSRVGSVVGSYRGDTQGDKGLKEISAYGIVRGSNYVGGLAGYLNGYRADIQNCVSHCKVESANIAGGLIGRIYTNSNVPIYISFIYYSYATGRVTAPTARGVVGSFYGGFNVYNVYWDIESTGTTIDRAGTGLTTSEMKDPANIASTWKTETSPWVLELGSYPLLWFEDKKSFAAIGTWESPIIDLGAGWKETKVVDILKKETENASVQINIATSTDGMHFTDFQPLDEDNLPQARYIKIRAVLSAQPDISGEDKKLDFDQTHEENMLKLTDYVEADGQLKLKTFYTHTAESAKEEENGKVFEHPIDKANFKKIERIEVK